MINALSTVSNDPIEHLAVPIVAIGGSATDPEPVSEMIAHLPGTTGMAYVYIQSQETWSESVPVNDAIAGITQVTTMPVLIAEDQMPVLPNHVYVISNGLGAVETTLDGGLIIVKESPADRSALQMPIDRFLMSLADHQRAGAVAVLLSGEASDGILGMRAIRAAGGLTFAQDESARYQVMPGSAIREGLVDRVLPPVAIARELAELSPNVSALSEAAGANAPEWDKDYPAEEMAEPVMAADLRETKSAGYSDVASLGESSPIDYEVGEEEENEDELRTIIDLIGEATGSDFTHYKKSTIRRRIIRRMLLFRLEKLSDYTEHLRRYPSEIRDLYDDLLINVTAFFRDTDTMEYLQSVLLPRLVEHKKLHEPLRIWVPACSTGQEAYSIIILLLEVLGDRASAFPIQLFATDLSESAVAKARLGNYSRSEVMNVSPWRLQRFFTKVDDQHYRLNKMVRDLCVFAPQNLLKDPPFSRLDFISCRNLLIYLDAPLQRKAMATFHYALNPGGLLLLGKSETVGPSSYIFSTLESNHKLYVRKNELPDGSLINRVFADMNTRSDLGPKNSVRPDSATGSPVVPPGQHQQTSSQAPSGFANRAYRPGSLPVSRQSKASRPANELDQAVNDLLLSKYAPPSVVVNQELDILQFRGATGLFLEPAPGRASLNLLKMAHPSLTFELRNVVLRARLENKAVRRSGLEIKVKGQVQYVAIEAIPIDMPTGDQLFVVLFEELATVVVTEGDTTDARNQRIKQLEEELLTLRDDMRSVIEEQEATLEELQSANEEIISSNEELQSINEELETSKEEIESTNEELLTINSELQVRNDQLSEANAFSEAIFGTISEATLVLSPQLRIRNANPMFHRLFELSESEVDGKLIYELGNQQWDIPQLRSLLTDVATRDMEVSGFELAYSFPGVGDKVLSLNARRVVQQQEAILLAINDITEHRRAQQLLKERQAWFRQIADNAPALTWVSAADGQYTFLNTVWLDYTGRSMEDVIRHGFEELIHPDDRKDYAQLYRTRLVEKKPFQTEYRLRRSDGEYHWMLENAQPTFATDGQFTGFISTAANVQGQKEYSDKLDLLVEQRTTELIRSRTTLQKTAEALQAVIDSSPASVILLKALRSPSGDITDFQLLVANRQFAQLIGQPIDQINQLKVSDFSNWLWGENTIENLARVVRTDTPIYVEQATQANSWLALAVAKQDDGVVITALDITNLRQLQQQREDLLNQVSQSGLMVEQLGILQKQAQERGEMLRTSSHDLRGSLGVIQGAAGLLPFADSDEEREQMLEMLQRNVQETVRLITELLDFARLETGQQQVQLGPFDAAELLVKLGENVRSLVERKGLEFELVGVESLPVEGDSLNVYRIAQNLILNALKYTAAGSITVRWGSTDPAEWYFSVQDTGAGMDKAVSEKLAFGGSDSSATDRKMSTDDKVGLESLSGQVSLLGSAPGEGIGLTIVRQLCSLLQGSLLVESKPGQGSVFRVVLPRHY